MWRRRLSKGMERIVQGHGQPGDKTAAHAFEVLSGIQSPGPDETFKREKREAVLESMTERLLETPQHAHRDAIVLKPRLSRSAVIKRVVLVPAIVIALFVVFTAGAYPMSLDKNPDSSLYGTKLFFEGVRESLTGSMEAKAQLELNYTQKRVEEMQYLTSHDIDKGAERCASRYTDNLAAAQSRIDQLTGDAFAQASAEFLDLTGNQLATLDGFEAHASGGLAPAIERARRACNGAMQGMMDSQQMRMGPGGGQNQPGGSGGSGGMGGQGDSGGTGGQGGDGMMPGGGTQGGDGSGGGMMSPGTSRSGMSDSGGTMSGSGGMSGSGTP